MIALLRKDYPWLLAFAVCGVVAPAIVLFVGGSFASTWIVPGYRGPMPGLITTYWIGAFCLAWLAAVRERWTGTEDLLRHRPVSFRRSFVTRVVLCLAVIAMWITIPISLHETLAPSTAAQRDVVEPGLWWTYVAAGTIAFGVFGAALFGFSVRASEWVKVATAGAIGFAVVIVGYALAIAPAGEYRADPWLYTIVQLAIAVAFIVFAVRQQAWGSDRDRPLPADLSGFTAVTVSAGFMVLLAFCASWSQGGILGAYDYPSALPAGDGLVIGSGKGRPWKEQCYLRRAWWDAPTGAFRRSGMGYIAHLAGDWVHLGYPLGRLTEYYLRRDTGMIHEIPRYQRVVDVDLARPFGKPPADEPLSPRARSTRNVVVDPDDGTAWRLRGAGLVPLALPAGAHATTVSIDDEDDNVFVHTAGGDRYRVIDTGLERAPDRAADRAPRRGLSSARVEVRVTDPLAPVVEVATPDGLTVRGVAALDSPVLTPLLYAMSVVRPPVLAAGSTAIPPRMQFAPADIDPATIFDPLVAGGRRWWLIVAAFVVSASLAAHVAMRMRRQRVNAARRWAWIAWVLLGGLAAYATYWIVEPRRSHLPTRRLQPHEIPVPLLESA